MKGQIQMGESIAIIIVIIIMIVLGLLFYSRINEAEIEEKGEIFQDLRAVQVAQIISNLPELSCTEGVTQDTTCVDLEKLKVFQEESKNYFSHYQNKFGDTSIIIHITYPITDTITAYEPNTASEQRDQDSIKQPIVIHDPLNNKNLYGYMEVLVYG